MGDLSIPSYRGGGALATARSGRKYQCDHLGRWSHVPASCIPVEKGHCEGKYLALPLACPCDILLLSLVAFVPKLSNMYIYNTPTLSWAID